MFTLYVRILLDLIQCKIFENEKSNKNGENYKNEDIDESSSMNMVKIMILMKWMKMMKMMKVMKDQKKTWAKIPVVRVNDLFDIITKERSYWKIICGSEMLRL